MFRHEQKPLVGIDIGSTSVKLVELSGTSPPFDLETIALVSVADDESNSSYERAVSLILESNTLESKRVATSVCGTHVAVRDLRFPRLAASEVEGAVWYEGGQVIAFDINDSYVDYAVVGNPKQSEESTSVLFAAAARSEVEFKTGVLEACGLEPRVVGVDMLVLLDALLKRSGIPETVAVLNMGARSTSVGITRVGSTPFVRDLDMAGNTYTKAISEAQGMNFQEAETAKIAESDRDGTVGHVVKSVTAQLIGELSRSMVYYKTRGHGSPVERVFVCGGSSRLPGLAQALSEAVDVPVELWSPIDDVNVDEGKFDLPSVEQLAPFVGLAAALAMEEDVH